MSSVTSTEPAIAKSTTSRKSKNKDKKLPAATGNLPEDADESIMRELCTVNGINYDKLHQSSYAAKVNKLEIFFFGCPRMPSGMHMFSNLSTLCIVNQHFDEMSGLQECLTLEELWICETQVQKIEGLSCCTNLVRLYLYSNKITKIEGLETLSKLEKLWLNGNGIGLIEGIEELYQLNDLNLSSNEITAIGHALDHLSQLETLGLSGNDITSLCEIVHLASLPKLRSLSLCHPMDSPNPVCRLCNYSTHTLYHLPQLNWLDGREVSSHDLRKLVQGLVARKIQYYRMKIHHCRTVEKFEEKHVEEKMNAHLETCNGKKRTLTKLLKCLSFTQAPSGDRESLLSKQVSLINCHIDKFRQICLDVCRAIREEEEQKCMYWLMELESGGNVKLTSYLSTHPCFKSCSELVHSRFSVTDRGVRNLGISGLEVTKVIRVENRLLFNCFNDKLKFLLDKEPYLSMTPTQLYKRMVDYFFLVWQPENESLCYICQDGFSADSLPCIWLTNSVNIADHSRLVKEKSDLAKVQSGQLLLCKVFVGQSAETTISESPSRLAFPVVDSVFRVYGPTTNTTPDNSADFHPKDWFVFDNRLVLPEYIIHFKYLSPHLARDPLEEFISENSLVTDEDIATLASSRVSLSPRLAMLDESTLLELTGHPSMASIQQVNLCNHRLTRFRLAPGLPQITSLILSSNELTNAEDFCHMPNLELLDVSYNKLTNLQGLKGVPRLTSLDISWNSLTNHHDDLGPLRKHCPLLESLDTRQNPWAKQERLREYIVGRLKTLRTVDGCLVTQEEASKAAKKFSSSHLTLTTLLSHSHVDGSLPSPSLNIDPRAHALWKEGQPYPLQQTINLGTDFNDKVTTVCLCDLGLRKLAHLDQLPNLRWLSLANNALTSLEDITRCVKLEELTLDNNQLSNLEGIANFPSLRWLSMSGNKLTALSCSLWGLSKLQYVNMCHNALSALHELKHLSGLLELYLSGNLVSSSRELLFLKSLTSLVVLDLTFNPLAAQTTYRSFVIFHLSFLKALDGRPIEVGEVAEAKEKLGGRLTQDFIFQKYPSLKFKDVSKLDLPNCGLKHVDLSPVQSFNNLASLNLEHNSLTSFSGLVHLSNLKVLCLNHNRIEHLLPAGDPAFDTDVLHNLQVLHLAYNGIVNVANLLLGRITSLRALFLQGNEICKVEGLQNLEALTELVLDRNKIKNLQEDSLAGLTNLKELHLEENRLRDLSHFKPHPCLERLYLGLNRIQDYSELEKLSFLENLVELSVMSNPVSRRLQHRILLVYQHPHLMSLDGVMITATERQVAEQTFDTDRQDVDIHRDIAFPSGATPLKVMNVPFGHNQSQQRRQPQLDPRALHGHIQNVQTFHDKKRGKK